MSATLTPADLRPMRAGRSPMRRTLAVGIAAVAAAAAVAVPLTPSSSHATPPAALQSGDIVRTWNTQALDAVRRNKASDAQAARLYAMVHAAMFDAVNGVSPTAWRRDAAFVTAPAGTNGDARLAAAQAAHDVLSAIYPADTGRFDDQLEADASTPTAPGAARHGRAWGEHVADAVLAARANDGSAGNQTQAGSTTAGRFHASWSGVQFRFLQPFVIDDSSDYFGGPPPAMTSATYTADFNEVRDIGRDTPADQWKADTFYYWALASGTSQPAGAWLQVADAVSADRALALNDTARLFALTSMAMADTVAPTYMTKFTHHTWRPYYAIRRAEEDGNPDTTAVPDWVQRGNNVGTSPEYWSGHSSFSAAGAAVLAGFFCDDAVPFALTTDNKNGETRSYPSFSAAAAEAGKSRVYGGLHFEFSNQSGLAAGRAVAAEVLATALLPANGAPTC